MKALDILIYILDCGGMIHVDREFMSNVSKAVEELEEHISGKDDQIKWLREELKYHEAELEALQQPKSCDDCRSQSCSVKRILLELGEINSSYFYCNDSEPKEQ